MPVIAIGTNFNYKYLQFLLELGDQQEVQMTAISTLCRGNEVFKELRPLFFEIFEFFALH